MPKRIPLNDSSFLGHVFSPKKNPVPSGIRKTSLKGLKGGRTKARLNAFNRMSPFNQELLKRSGQRDAYLRGEASLRDAKETLRPKAILAKVARPLRGAKVHVSRETSLDRAIAERLKKVVRDAGRPVNHTAVDSNIVHLGNDASEQMTMWSYGEFKHAGRKGSEYEYVDSSGNTRNPLWYH